MAQSLACGERVTLSKVDAFAGGAGHRPGHLPAPAGGAESSGCVLLPLIQHKHTQHKFLAVPADGVALKHVGAETFRLCRELLDGIVLVDNAATSAAIKVTQQARHSTCECAFEPLANNATRPLYCMCSACLRLLSRRMCLTRLDPSLSPRARWRWRAPRPTCSTTG